MEGKTSATIVVRSVSERMADLKTTIVDFRRRVLAGQLRRLKKDENLRGVGRPSPRFRGDSDERK